MIIAIYYGYTKKYFRRSVMFSVESSLKEILKNEEAKKVIIDNLGEDVLNNPMLKMVMRKSLSTIASMSGGKITDEMLETIDSQLKAV